MNSRLLQKYNVPVPRYTSYPTVPYWQEDCPDEAAWKGRVLEAFAKNQEISLYIHLPFCEALCTYCGCNKRITKNHAVETPYIKAVLQEWQMYLDLLPQKPVLRELHLGGGTPTFFSPDSLDYLLRGILEKVELADRYEFGFEAHPGSTTREHLETLANLGFTRLSIGVQDFDPEIMIIINRHQTEEQVREVTRMARALGYESINFDLIFGLPLQTKEHIRRNMAVLAELRPERLAFYSYAHVPWISPSQRAYSEADLPVGAEKRALYELGRALLEGIGYREIGMDHFALPVDSLSKAMDAGQLHRSFMGYTPFSTELNLALGASSISDSWHGYVQNEKRIETYQERVGEGELPIVKGHLLTREDEIIRGHILGIMCRYETSWSQADQRCDALFKGLDHMQELMEDGLVHLEEERLVVTALGRPFIRNICQALDARLWAKRPGKQVFSQAV